LIQPWCLAEIGIAFATRITTITVVFEDFISYTDGHLESLEFSGLDEVFSLLGITLLEARKLASRAQAIPHAIQWPVKMTDSIVLSAIQELVSTASQCKIERTHKSCCGLGRIGSYFSSFFTRCGSKCKICSVELRRHSADAKNDSSPDICSTPSVIMIVDNQDSPGVAAGLLLVFAAKLDDSPELDVKLTSNFEPEMLLPSISTNVDGCFVLLLTCSVFSSPQCVAVSSLVALTSSRVLLPLLLPGFRLPTGIEYSSQIAAALNQPSALKLQKFTQIRPSFAMSNLLALVSGATQSFNSHGSLDIIRHQSAQIRTWLSESARMRAERKSEAEMFKYRTSQTSHSQRAQSTWRQSLMFDDQGQENTDYGRNLSHEIVSKTPSDFSAFLSDAFHPGTGDSKAVSGQLVSTCEGIVDEDRLPIDFDSLRPPSWRASRPAGIVLLMNGTVMFSNDTGANGKAGFL